MAPVSPLAPHGATTRIGKSGSGHFPRQPKIPGRDQEFGDSRHFPIGRTGNRTHRWRKTGQLVLSRTLVLNVLSYLTSTLLAVFQVCLMHELQTGSLNSPLRRTGFG